MKPARLYLLRHGRAAPPGILIGQSDYPLLPEGEREIRAQAGRLAEIFFAPSSAAPFAPRLDFFWSSPLARARRSAELVAQALPEAPAIEIVDEFREVSLGRWEGLTKAEILKADMALWVRRGLDPAGLAPPEGENFCQLAQRVLPAYRRLRERLLAAPAGAAGLIVAHQAVNRVILSRALSIPLGRIWDIPQPSAALSLLELRPEGDEVLELGKGA